jgi:dolichol-phosphate mannosyltransferase
MKITVIIPTYNEGENIKILIPSLLEEFKNFKSYDFSILVVDGNSKDDTAKNVKVFQKNYKNIFLIEESSKSGLGSAYIKGFEYAIQKIHPDYVVEMDADLQHDPKDFTSMVNEIKNNYDLILGSRYVPGGSVPKEWDFKRKFISYFGSLFARFALRIFKVKDFTTGFKLTRVRGLLDKIDFEKVASKGFAYKIDLLAKMYDMNIRIKEVPITFGLRDRGTSKMEQKNFKDSLNVVLRYSAIRNKNFLKFIVVGFGGLVIDYSVFNLAFFVFHILDYPKFISGFTAMIFTFTMNNFFSFKERRKTSIKEFIPYISLYIISSSIPIYVGQQIIDYTRKMFGKDIVAINVAFFLGIFLGLIWNFTVYSKIIWRKKA